MAAGRRATRRVERESLSPVRHLVLDSGAVVAISRGDARAREHLVTASRAGLLVVMPSIVLLEVLRPQPDDPAIRHVLAAVHEIVPLTRAIAEHAAILANRSGVTDLADAIVVAEALQVGGSHILTGGLRDVLSLLEAAPERGMTVVHRL